MKTPYLLPGLQRLGELVNEAPDDMLLMSRNEYHAFNVSSIVLGRTSAGGLRRVFLAWPGHKLDENTLQGRLTVGIHNHRYSIDLTLLLGNVQNIVCKRALDNGRVLHEFDFRTGNMKWGPGIRYVGLAGIVSDYHQLLHCDFATHLPGEKLHTIACRGPAAWIVEEGAVEREVTRLFSPNREINTADLYQPFETAHDVRYHVMQFAEAARLYNDQES